MTAITLPPDHPRRAELSQEVHARPPEPLMSPASVSYIALHRGPDDRGRAWEAAAELAKRNGKEPPDPDANHYSVRLGDLRVKWERHTEFVRYTFIRMGAESGAPFSNPPIAELPSDWLASLPGEVIFAAHVLIVNAPDTGPAIDETVERVFSSAELVGSDIASGAGVALTDFRTHEDGFNRFLIRNRGMSPLQAGRHLQRLLEMDTYRMMALLGLPVARDLGGLLTERERELAAITREMAADERATDERALLDRLTRLEADVERRHSEHTYRFSASAAYYGIVQARIVELRERRVEGLQTFAEFTERRLAPAMNTVEAVATRLESTSRHLARATTLLSTRVALAQEEQTRELLEAMARRAKLQLRLQQTVEGLSVAAITYYVVGLIAYFVAGLKGFGIPFDPVIATALSVPVVALGIAYSVRRVRKAVERAED